MPKSKRIFVGRCGFPNGAAAIVVSPARQRAGPITNPNDLGPAIKRSLEGMKRGDPALFDGLTQPR